MCTDHCFSTIFLLYLRNYLINSNHSNMSEEAKLNKIHILLYSHARKQSILKEMLSRETDEPGPGPFSVLNWSQNLQWDTSVLAVDGSIASKSPQKYGSKIPAALNCMVVTVHEGKLVLFLQPWSKSASLTSAEGCRRRILLPGSAPAQTRSKHAVTTATLRHAVSVFLFIVFKYELYLVSEATQDIYINTIFMMRMYLCRELTKYHHWQRGVVTC